MYISIDGDDIGTEIERFIVLCQPEPLVRYWEQVSRAMAKLRREIESFGAEIIIFGGDTILARITKEPEPELIDALFSSTSPLSFSVGTGHTMLEAYVALKTAKASGKNCWVDYRDLVSIRRLG
jgi:GTP cyclohydrolase III